MRGGIPGIPHEARLDACPTPPPPLRVLLLARVRPRAAAVRRGRAVHRPRGVLLAGAHQRVRVLRAVRRLFHGRILIHLAEGPAAHQSDGRKHGPRVRVVEDRRSHRVPGRGARERAEGDGDFLHGAPRSRDARARERDAPSGPDPDERPRWSQGSATESPVHTQEQRDEIVAAFAAEVRKLRHQPAMLFWSFGNELNGVWNGYLQQLGHTERDPCAWDDRYDDKGGCWVHTGTAPTPSSPCYASSACVYSRLFKFINDAAVAAKEASARARARARDPQPPRSAPSGSPLVALL